MMQFWGPQFPPCCQDSALIRVGFGDRYGLRANTEKIPVIILKYQSGGQELWGGKCRSCLTSAHTSILETAHFDATGSFDSLASR